MNKKVFLFSAFVILTCLFGFLKAESGDYTTLGYDTPDGYSFWRVDSSGYFKPGVASTLDIGTAALPVRNIYAGGLVGATLTSGTLTSPTITGATITGPTITGPTITGTATMSIVNASSVTLSGFLGLKSKTIAELTANPPSAKGQLFYCSDCISATQVVYSTNTTVRGWALITSSTTYPI